LIERANETAQEAQFPRRFALTEALLEAERVELAQVPGKSLDPRMKEMQELGLLFRGCCIAVVDREQGSSALAEDVDRLMRSRMEDPGCVDSGIRPLLPEREKELLKQIRGVLGGETVLPGDASGGSREVRRCQPLADR
jgi:hypothetical protein